MSVKVIGLDLSMTSTGVCWSGPTGPEWTTIRTVANIGDGRLRVIQDRVRDIVADVGPDLVVIEGYLNHSKTAGITGMVHGAVRTTLMAANIPYATFAPSSLKKYATGVGNADKTRMALAAFKRGGIEFKDDNQCDAWWLWVAGMDHLGDPPLTVPVTNIEALEKIRMEWTR